VLLQIKPRAAAVYTERTKAPLRGNNLQGSTSRHHST